MPVDGLSAALRALWLLALLQACGAACFLAAFGAPLGPSARRIRGLALAATGVAALALAAFYLLEAARMAGELGGMGDAGLRALVWSGNRAAIVARLVGLALLAGALVGRVRAVPAIAGTLAIAGSFALIGHSSDATLAARALVVLHVLIATGWAGALAPLVLVTRDEDGRVAAAVVARFTALATFTVPLLAVVGVALALLLGVRAPTLARPYGFLLLAKLGGFAVLMLLAALNKWRLGPRLANDPVARSTFVTSVALEGALIVGVLVATATLTTFFSPEM